MTLSITNLVHYHKLDETSGTRYDSKNSYNLTPYGNTAPNYDTGILNNAVSFVRGQNQYLEYSWGGVPPYSYENLTLTCWIYPLETSASYFCCPIAISGQTYYNYIVKFERLKSATTPYFRVSYRMTTAGYSIYAAAETIPQDQWTFLAFRLKKNGTSNYTYSAYLGKGGNFYYSDRAETLALLNPMYTSECRFVVGQHPNNPADQLNTRIDEVGVWNEALALEDIQALYNNGSPPAFPFTTTTQEALLQAKQYLLMSGGNLTPSKHVLQQGGCL